MERIKSAFSNASQTGNETQSVSDMFTEVAGGENESMCPTLSFKNRLIGFGFCTGIGMFIGIMSWICIILAEYTLFGVLYTLANITSIAGTMFLAGPKKQIEGMFAEKRWIATAIYLVSMIVTIVVAVTLKSAILVLIFCVIQFCAMWWYFLSYIPFARSAIRGVFTGMIR